MCQRVAPRLAQFSVEAAQPRIVAAEIAFGKGLEGMLDDEASPRLGERLGVAGLGRKRRQQGFDEFG
jgi:hypothetical protein